MRLIDYLKYKRITLAAFFIFALIAFACLALSDVPLRLLMYPFVLCILAGLVFLSIGYLRCRKTYDELKLIGELHAEMIDTLPAPVSPQDVQYQQIIQSLCAENMQRQARLTGRYKDLLDYYSAWTHQIKTPIAAMKLKFQNEDSALARQSLNDLKRIEQYVDMALTYLKLDSDDIDYVIQEHDLDDIIRQAIRSFAGEFIDRKIGLDYETVSFKVLTDDKWLVFVLEQILSNALKYTSQGSIRIYMKGSTLCVEDTGIGIAAADVPRVFEKGFTGYNGRKDKRASGIGLYLCKRICDNLSHGISVESEAGSGTTVMIDLQQSAVGIE